MKKILLIDANSILHRTYHALPPLTGPDGTPTGALFGTTRIMLRILEIQHPDYVVAAFDRPEPTFRKKEFEAYKAHRPKADEALISQIIEARSLFSALGIAISESPGFEADDIIGTFVKKYSKTHHIIIFTGDLDSLQLVSNHVVVESFKKGVSETITYTPDIVYKRFGVPPEKIPDFKGLTGDASDNIPGVKGVGPKTAAALLSKYGSLENFFAQKCVDKKFEKIHKASEIALLSKRLATIRTDVPITTSIESFLYKKDEEKFIAYATAKGFSSIIKRKEPQQHFEISKEKIETDIFLPKRINGVLVGYDLKEILKRKEYPGPYFDIKIAAWLLDPDRDSSFASITATYHTNELSKLKEILEQKMIQEGVEKVFYTIETPLIPILAEIEETGIQVDRNKLSELKKQIQEERDAIEKIIFSEAGERFNILSPIQVSNILFKKLGINQKKKKKTKTGIPSTSEEVLKKLKNDHPIISHILKYREHSKILSTYIDPLLQHALTTNGIIHTSFIQTGTATGRFSSEKPNLQNIPQESEWAKPLRDCFTARPGKCFVSFDYSQLELRILAHLSKDEHLKNIFLKDGDVHTTTAAYVFNVPETLVDSSMRRIAKTLNFGIVYGMGPRAFSEASGIPLEEAKHFIEEYFKDFPKVSEWRESIRKEIKSGIVRNENGRIRKFPLWNNTPRAIGAFERAAINMPIQSLEADILKIAMCKSNEMFHSKKHNDVSLVLTIHDELIFEISDDRLNETIPLIQNIMENSYSLSVPLLVETKKGKTLGSMEKINKL